MKFQDIIAFAKAGWTLKDVKEALELTETSPDVKETDPETLKHKDDEDDQTDPQEKDEPDKKEEPDPKKQPDKENGGSILDKLFD